MSDTEINIAIAEVCGWHRFIINDEYGPDRALKPGQVFETGCVFTLLPNYCTDLNAMHEAEKVLLETKSRWEGYCNGLRWMVFPVWHATARQRAECFLRTLSLWRE